MKLTQRAKTGNCKLQAFDYPVRIYCTDGGQTGDMIHGAYKDREGWHSCAWDADGSPRFGTTKNAMSLIPMPKTVFFNIYTQPDTGEQSIGMLYEKADEAMNAWRLHKECDAQLFTKVSNKVELIATNEALKA